jgi:hypothetical protein
MKTMKYFSIMLLMMGMMTQAFGQFTSKEQAKSGGNSQEGAITPEELFKNTTRKEDIEAFTQTSQMLENAISSGAVQETKTIRDQLVQLTLVEIARSKHDLGELNKGNTANLEKWHATHNPDRTINLKMEIQTLTNRINHDEYLSDRIAKWDLSDLSDKRMMDGLMANARTFERNMERNLKYSADERLVAKNNPPGGKDQTGQATTTTETGYITVSDQAEIIDKDDPRLNNYLGSKDMRKKDYLTAQANMKTYLEKGDQKMAKKEYKELVKLMMDEVNSNNWMLNMIRTGTVKNSGIDANQLESKVNKQRSLMETASQMKSNMSTDPSLINEAMKLVTQFGQTL